MDRIEKVNEQMKREISHILQADLKDPRVQLSTITQVVVSRDLRHAKVSFSVLGDAKKVREAQESLNKARGYIRKLIGERINLRYTPEIDFVYDKSIEYSARIEQALEEIKNEHKEDPSNH
ncbi:MAG: ribosome-binding factor A [Omnitrophica WOR_2 bacterium GWA2_47_8]|nr:MAG: ribosome-binding factor A [Omnitrophica WOR_2 bacterium GWA2_47_8]